ncbi:acetyl-CoA hydrolase/transferase family protein [bacterium]|nr:MAG: acetyl-CoA hydrolase/transferase family protein [bacterium]
MDWKQIYDSKVVTAEQAVRAIKSGNRVFMTGNCSVPHRLLNALVQYAPQLENVELCQALTVAGSEYVAPELEGHLRVNSVFISTNVRKAVQEGRADFTPVMLSEVPLLFKNNVRPLDVALIHTSPPDRNGYCSYGVETGLTKTAAESARIIIAQVNKRMPRILGDTLIHVKDMDYIVPVDDVLAELPMENGDDGGIVEKIAGFIAERIPDGATMQLGIGGIPNAVLHFLKDKKDLGVHSELFSDSIIGLVEAGVITGARKSIHKNKIIAGFMIGTRRLYDWADDNPVIELHCTEYVNHPFTVAQNDRMVAINSAIEVDLTGQVCADSIGTKLFSGVGGQMDFIFGASMSKEGLPIIALPATACLRDGSTISRITPMLKPGAGVVTTRNHIRYVATEYGMVNLYGRTIRERTHLLISIAHPDFREDLKKQASALHYI